MLWIKNSKQYREQTSQKISWGHWFAFFNILLAIIIGSRYAFLIDWPHTLFGSAYFFISLLGHFSFISFAAYLLTVFPLSFIIKNQRTFRGISVIIATILITLLMVDTEVFARFNLHLTTLVWNLLVNPENGELSRDWQLFFTPMPFILLIQMLFSRWVWHKLRSFERQKWIRSIGTLLTCLFIATHLIYAWADVFVYRPITMQKSNFPLSYPMTARTFLEKRGLLDKQQYELRLTENNRTETPTINYPKQKLTFEQVENKSNILIITVAGLRQDAIQAEKMPLLTKFSQNATEFVNHYSTGNNEKAAVTGLFYGLNASYADSLLHNQKTSVVISKLQQENYQFGLFSANNFQQNIFKQALFRQIKLAESKTGNQNAIQNWKLWFEHRNKQQPWFSYLNLDITKAMANKNFVKIEQEQEVYQQQLSQLDTLLQTVFEQLRQQDQINNTLIMITAETGYSFQKTSSQRLNYFAPEQIKVPLIIAWKALSVGKEDKLTSHIDIVPTLMSLFKIKNPDTDYSQGRNLFDATQPKQWVLAANYRWNVIIKADGSQYHIDRKGNYQKYNNAYQKQSSSRAPLGLFLEVYNQNSSFMEK